MADPIEGKLLWQGKGKKRKQVVTWKTKKGKWATALPVSPGSLSADLEGVTEGEVAVSVELENGRPFRIWRQGSAWVPPAFGEERGGEEPRRNAFPAQSHGGAPQDVRRNRGGNPSGSWGGKKGRKETERDFHNPYNFVPAPPRSVEDPDLGDHEPCGHDRYLPDRYSGRLCVRMRLETPLLLPDTARVWVTGRGKDLHKSYPVRVDAAGRPWILPTSVKGMLRSAYEAVTNSRFGVFQGHEDRLAFRAQSSSALKLVPARIERQGEKWIVRLYPGTSPIGNDGKPPKQNCGDGPKPLLYAAWLRRYKWHGKNAPTLPNGDEHGRKVWAYITLWNHGNFYFWNVEELREMQPSGGEGGKCNRESWSSIHPVRNVPGQWVEGYICHTNWNIENKHDERLFFSTPRNRPVTVSLSDGEWEGLRRQWRELIDNYRKTHEDAMGKLEPPPQDLEWSRHIERVKEVQELSEGTLCHAEVERSPNGGFRVVALYPVMISRKLFEVSPAELLDRTLHPPAKLSELSPADRLFGWVNQKRKGAWRGLVRIGAVSCQTSPQDAIESFVGEDDRYDPDGCGLPLAILSTPKPQQARFYVARSPQGESQYDGISKEQAAYRAGKGLRGRKVYPHHRNLPEEYWDDPKEDRTQHSNNGHYQAYRRPRKEGEEQRDNQNRSMHGWVKPGTRFTFEIAFMNLSGVELGALLWLLQLPEGHFHRLGGGKPLGFGSVRLELVPEASMIRSGKEMWERFRSLDEPAPANDPGQRAQMFLHRTKDPVEAFKEALCRAYGKDAEPFEKIPFISAFLQGTKGFDDGLPIHYPRSTPQPHSEGKSFEWFVANERSQKGAVPGYALPDLTEEIGLPILHGKGGGGRG